MSATTLQEIHLDSVSLPLTNWKIDPARSSASFAVENRLMLVMNLTVSGTFSGVNGLIAFDEAKPEHSRAEITIDAATVNTKMAKRDLHLRSADYFDVDRYPRIKFLSTAIKAVDRARGDYQVKGLLTIRNVSHMVTFDLLFTPPQSNAGDLRMILTGKAKIDRREFGLTWSKPPMSKPAHEVELTISIEATPA